MYFQQHMRKLDKRLQPFLRPDFFFVNVGANDGVINDPIYPFIAKYGWRGIAVEPVPHVFERLRVNYRAFPDVVLEQVAISEQTRPIWFVRPGSGSAEYAVQQIGSLDAANVHERLTCLRQVPNQGPTYAEGLDAPLVHDTHFEEALVTPDVAEYVDRADVECISFNALMERHEVDHVDFLNIDTEGCDWEVLRSVDFDRYRPELLCVEVTALADGETDELNALIEDQEYAYLQHVGIHSRIYASKRARRSGSSAAM